MIGPFKCQVELVQNERQSLCRCRLGSNGARPQVVRDPFDPGNRQAESTPDGLHDFGRPIEIVPADCRSLGSEPGDAIRKSDIAGSQFSISECDQGAQSASRRNWSDDEAIPHAGHGNVGEPGDLVDRRR